MVENNNPGDPLRDNPDKSDPSCATPSSAASGQNWKTALLVAVILVAGAVAGHSLLKNDWSYSKGGSCGGDPACSVCPFSKTAVAGKPCAGTPQGMAGQGDAEETACCRQQAGPSNDNACCPNSVCPIGSGASTAKPAQN